MGSHDYGYIYIYNSHCTPITWYGQNWKLYKMCKSKSKPRKIGCPDLSSLKHTQVLFTRTLGGCRQSQLLGFIVISRTSLFKNVSLKEWSPNSTVFFRLIFFIAILWVSTVSSIFRYGLSSNFHGTPSNPSLRALYENWGTRKTLKNWPMIFPEQNLLTGGFFPHS